MASVIEIIIYVIAGGLVSLITLWVNWKIEEKKKRFLWRKDFTNECKKIVDINNFNPDTFRETAHYSNLKPNLSGALQKEVDEQRYIPGMMMSPEQRGELTMKEYAVKKKLLDEISSLEKKWGIL